MDARHMDAERKPATLRVLRVCHSAVVDGYRARERAMRRLDADIVLVTPRRWNEGGADVALTDPEPWVIPTRTIGKHPYLFLYDPVPILRAMRSVRFDVLDVHEEPASLAAFELRMLSRLRHRTTPMAMYGAQNLDKRYPWVFRWIERTSFRRITAVYPCNRAAGEIFRRRGFRGLVRELPLGAPVGDIGVAADPRNARPGGEILIGYVGRLEEHKGVEVLLRAVSLLPDRFRLRLVGEGGHRAALETLASSLGLSDRVEFAGFLSDHQVNRTYAEFDLVAVPSQTRPNWVEQFGRVAVEAMAAGVPVIVADSGALPDVAGDVALVVPEADHAAWATAIEALADDPVDRSRRRRLGLERAAEFGWDSIAERHVALYREMIS